MSAVLKYVQPEEREIQPLEFGLSEIHFLNKMRVTSLRCRSSARLDMGEACALVRDHEGKNEELVLQALVRTMRQGLNKSPDFLSPTNTEFTFDETWLLRCLVAIKSNDNSSLTFLIKRRVALPYQRAMVFLIGSVSEYFPLI